MCNNHASWVKTEGLGLRVLPVPLPTTIPHLQERSKIQECGQVHQENQEETRRKLDLQAGDLATSI